ncbi:MAG: hypothetical protein SGCHY_000734 [Lobulomycetales sp.]
MPTPAGTELQTGRRRSSATDVFQSESFQHELALIEENTKLTAGETLEAVVGLVRAAFSGTERSSDAMLSSPGIKSTFDLLPYELQLSVYSYLDVASLLQCMQTCRYWNGLISDFSETLFRNLLHRDFNIRSPSQAKSYQEMYRVSHNVAEGKYKFSAVNDTVVSADDPHDCISKYVTVWAANPNQAYTIGIYIFNLTYMETAEFSGVIYCAHENTIKMFSPRESCNGQLEFEYLGQAENAHLAQVGLILSNGKGLLASFDESSITIIWDVLSDPHSPRIVSKLFDRESSEIFSLNIYEHLLVTGGRDGKVSVYNCLDASLHLQLQVPQVYESALSSLHLLNVTLSDSLVCHGLYDGTYRLFDMESSCYTFRFRVNKNEGQYSVFKYEPGVSNILDEHMDLDLSSTLAPMTLALNRHFLVTNGLQPDRLIVWDVNKGMCLYALSEQISLERLGLYISPFREVNFAETSGSQVFLFSAVSHHMPGVGGVEKYGLLSWDFENRPTVDKRQRSFIRGKLELSSLEGGDDETDVSMTRFEEREVWIIQ